LFFGDTLELGFWNLDVLLAVQVDLALKNHFTGRMRLCLLVCLLLAGLVVSGCASHPRVAQKQSPPPTTSVSTTNQEPIVTPDTSLNAKVVNFNSVGRFVVLSFPVGQMPQIGQTLFIYRAGLKVGEVKVTGPQKDNDIVADLTTGEAEAGDDVHEP
jgi:hypothetical protein